MRKLWASWRHARAQTSGAIMIALSLAVVVLLAVYIGYSLLTGHQAGGR